MIPNGWIEEEGVEAMPNMDKKEKEGISKKKKKKRDLRRMVGSAERNKVGTKRGHMVRPKRH